MDLGFAPCGSNQTSQDCDDDGEQQGGKRLLELLVLRNDTSVLVVATWIEAVGEAHSYRWDLLHTCLCHSKTVGIP